VVIKRSIKAEAVGLEPAIPIHRDTCFRDRLLIQPDDFDPLPEN